MSGLAYLQLDYISSVCSALDAATHLNTYQYNTEVAWIQDCVQTVDAEFDTITTFSSDEEVRAFRIKLNAIKLWLDSRVVLM